MIRSINIVLLFGAALLATADVLAQVNVVASNPPKLRPPPTRGAWVISYKSDKPEKASAPSMESGNGMMVSAAAFAPSEEVTSRQYTVDGKLAKSVTRYSGGKTVTGYIIDMVGVRERADDPDDLVLDQLSSSYFAGSDFRTHFPGLEWVRPEHYKGVVELEKVRYHYFAEGSPPPAAASSVKSIFDRPDLSDFSGGAGREALLTDEGWPRQTKEGGVIATYTFKSADAIEPISVPEKFHAVVQAFFDSLSPKDPAYSGNQ